MVVLTEHRTDMRAVFMQWKDKGRWGVLSLPRMTWYRDRACTADASVRLLISILVDLLITLPSLSVQIISSSTETPGRAAAADWRLGSALCCALVYLVDLPGRDRLMSFLWMSDLFGERIRRAKGVGTLYDRTNWRDAAVSTLNVIRRMLKQERISSRYTQSLPSFVRLGKLVDMILFGKHKLNHTSTDFS